MRIAVWVREIHDTRDLVGDVLDAGSAPKWSEWEGRFDPEDLNALEMALQIKDNDDGVEVVAVTVGEAGKPDVLRECLYRGVDRVIRVVPDGKTADIMGESKAFAAAVQKIESVDALFTGIQLNETETAQKAAMAARFLGWPLVSYVEAVEGVTGEGIRLRRAIEGGIQVVEASRPAAVSVGVALLKEDPRAPRSAKAKLKLKHKKTAVPQWTLEELGLSAADLEGPVKVEGFRAVTQRDFPSTRVDGTDSAALKTMIDALKQEGLVR